MKQLLSKLGKCRSKLFKKYLLILFVCICLVYFGLNHAQLSGPEKVDKFYASQQVYHRPPSHQNVKKRKNSTDKKHVVKISHKETDPAYIPQRLPLNFDIAELLLSQNEDGSIGETEKALCTSLVLLSFLSYGETFHSKKYGKEIKKMALFLAEKTSQDESPKEKIMVLRAISNLWSMTANNYFLYSYKKRLNEYLEDIKYVSEMNDDQQYYLSSILRHSEAVIPNDIWDKKKLEEVNFIDWRHQSEKVHLILPNIYNSGDKEIIHRSLDCIEFTKTFRYLPESKY